VSASKNQADCRLNFQLALPWEAPWALWGVCARVSQSCHPTRSPEPRCRAAPRRKPCRLCGDLSRVGKEQPGSWQPGPLPLLGVQTPDPWLNTGARYFEERVAYPKEQANGRMRPARCRRAAEVRGAVERG